MSIAAIPERRPQGTIRHSHRRLLLKVHLAVFATIACVLAVEAALRMIFFIPGPGYAEWACRPHSELVLISAPDKLRTVHRFNSLGFRGQEVSLTPSTPVRIICLGDSWTEGVGADEDEAWPMVLQRSLAEQRYEVVNLGSGGSPPDRYLRILAEAGIPLRPTHAIACLIPSDFIGGPKVPEHLVAQQSFPDPFHRRDGWFASICANALPGWTYAYDRTQGRWEPRTGLYWDAWSPQRDAILIDALVTREHITSDEARRLAEKRMQGISPQCLQAAHEGKFNPARILVEVVRPYASFKCRSQDMEFEVADLVEATRSWIECYAGLCRDQGITPILVFFPEHGLVSDAPCGPVEDEALAGRPSVAGDQSLVEMLRSLCHESDVQLIDCTPPLREHADERLFLRYDGHPTARAYEIAGRYIAGELSRTVLRP